MPLPWVRVRVLFLLTVWSGLSIAAELHTVPKLPGLAPRPPVSLFGQGPMECRHGCDCAYLCLDPLPCDGAVAALPNPNGASLPYHAGSTLKCVAGRCGERAAGEARQECKDYCSQAENIPIFFGWFCPNPRGGRDRFVRCRQVRVTASGGAVTLPKGNRHVGPNDAL